MQTKRTWAFISSWSWLTSVLKHFFKQDAYYNKGNCYAQVPIPSSNSFFLTQNNYIIPIIIYYFKVFDKRKCPLHRPEADTAERTRTIRMTAGRARIKVDCARLGSVNYLSRATAFTVGRREIGTRKVEGGSCTKGNLRSGKQSLDDICNQLKDYNTCRIYSGNKAMV